MFNRNKLCSSIQNCIRVIRKAALSSNVCLKIYRYLEFIVIILISENQSENSIFSNQPKLSHKHPIYFVKKYLNKTSVFKTKWLFHFRKDPSV